MNWNIPVMEDSPRPVSPQWWRWGMALPFFLIAGLLLAIYALPETELQDKPHLLRVACGGPFLLWLLLFGLRLSLHEFTLLRINTRNDLLAVRRHQWKRWANQGCCALVSAHYTVPDAQGIALSAGSSAPVNHNNRLIFEHLAGQPEWERRAALLSHVLTPLADYFKQHALNAPVSILFQCPPDEAESWMEEIHQQAQRLALPLAEVQPLGDETLPGWLMAAADSAPQTLAGFIFAELSEASDASEEAAGLLLASPAFCHRHKLIPVCRLPRPLLTPYAQLPEALALQGKQQHPVGKISHASYTLLSAGQTEKLQLLRAEQMTACAALFDVDSALGNAGCARTAVQLALAIQAASPTLLFSSHKGECWLQQVIPGDPTWQA